jgi:nucleolar pre-ribosomal-associated protein 1
MSKGLQSSSSLVQHCTALALAKCLVKYAEVKRIFHEVQATLEEDEDDGQWSNVEKEIEREVRRRIPEFQVVVGFSQQKPGENAPQSGDKVQSAGQINLTKGALLSESAQRLLWLYHRCLPALVAEVRFDVGKLLLNSMQNTVEMEQPHESGLTVVARFWTIRELHVLRLLKESDQFAWFGKSRVYSSITACFWSDVFHSCITSQLFIRPPSNIHQDKTVCDTSRSSIAPQREPVQ